MSLFNLYLIGTQTLGHLGNIYLCFNKANLGKNPKILYHVFLATPRKISSLNKHLPCFSCKILKKWLLPYIISRLRRCKFPLRRSLHCTQDIFKGTRLLRRFLRITRFQKSNLLKWNQIKLQLYLNMILLHSWKSSVKSCRHYTVS